MVAELYWVGYYGIINGCINVQYFRVSFQMLCLILRRRASDLLLHLYATSRTHDDDDDDSRSSARLSSHITLDACLPHLLAVNPAGSRPSDGGSSIWPLEDKETHIDHILMSLSN